MVISSIVKLVLCHRKCDLSLSRFSSAVFIPCMFSLFFSATIAFLLSIYVSTLWAILINILLSIIIAIVIGLSTQERLVLAQLVTKSVHSIIDRIK